jgi:hypothetical protein
VCKSRFGYNPKAQPCGHTPISDKVTIFWRNGQENQKKEKNEQMRFLEKFVFQKNDIVFR